MIFGGRIKRLNSMAIVTDPLVHKSVLMMAALLKTQLNEEAKFPDEILLFSMWLVYLAFSTAKPNASKKEAQALNDSYNQVFSNMADEAYKISELSSKITLTAFRYTYSKKLMNSFIARLGEYNDAFNIDKGTAFTVPDIEFNEFVPINLLTLAIWNIYGEEYAISDPSELNKDFIIGFMEFFTSTVAEGVNDFENFNL